MSGPMYIDKRYYGGVTGDLEDEFIINYDAIVADLNIIENQEPLLVDSFYKYLKIVSDSWEEYVDSDPYFDMETFASKYNMDDFIFRVRRWDYPGLHPDSAIYDKGELPPPGYEDQSGGSEPDFWSVVGDLVSKFTTNPWGAAQISEGVQKYVAEFIYGLFSGDWASAQEKINDVDNLTSNLLLYLTARGISKESLEKMGIGYTNAKGEFVPDMTLMYQFSYVLKNQMSDMLWEGYSEKYTSAGTEYYRHLVEDFGGFEWKIRDWSYSKHGNTLDNPASGGWMKSKFGDYYIRKNLY